MRASWRKGRRFGWVAVALAIGALAGIPAGRAVLAGRDQPAPATVLVANDVPKHPDPGPIGLQGALAVLSATIASWPGDWTIVSVASSDVNDAADAASGMDGLRATWQAAAVSSTGEQRWIRLTGGEIVDLIVPGGPVARRPPPALAAAMDSPEIVALVRAHWPAFAGRSAESALGAKGLGVQFTLALDEHSGWPGVVVTGSLGPDAIRVEVDPEAKAIVRAERLTLPATLLQSNPAGTGWREAAMPGVVPAHAAWAGDRLVVAGAEGSALVVLAQEPDGSWTRAAVLGEASVAVRDMAVVVGGTRVLLATANDLWEAGLEDGSVARQPMANPTQVLVDGEGTVHVLSVEGGETRYQSREAGGRWSEAVPTGGHDRLWVDRTGVHRYTQGRSLVDGGAPVFRVSGSPELMVGALDDGRLSTSRDGGRTWAPAAEGPGVVRSVWTSPGWPAEGVAYAIEFRGRLWRTGDGGTTWTPVLEPGGGDGAFGAVSESGAFAMVILGRLSWEVIE